jgi:hypothetical protein
VSNPETPGFHINSVHAKTIIMMSGIPLRRSIIAVSMRAAIPPRRMTGNINSVNSRIEYRREQFVNGVM